MHRDPMPSLSKKSVNAFDTVVAPLGIELRWPDKQLVHPQRIASKLAYEIIGIDNISLRLRHLFCFSALADVRDHPLIEQAQERFVEADDADIVKKHGEEPRIEQMKDRVFDTTHVHIYGNPAL